MKILTNKTYEDLVDQIAQGDKSIKHLVLERRAAEKKLDEEKKANALLIDEKDKLIRKNLHQSEELNAFKDVVAKLQMKFRKIAAKTGGLTKQNNKLKSELNQANEKLNNYKEEFRKIHEKKTVNEYDKKLKSINKIKK